MANTQAAEAGLWGWGQPRPCFQKEKKKKKSMLLALIQHFKNSIEKY